MPPNIKTRADHRRLTRSNLGRPATSQILIQLDNGHDRYCQAWSSASSASVVQVVVTASIASTSAVNAARDLYGRIQNALLRGNARRQQSKCGGSFGPGVQGCWASSHSGPVRRVLVWVADNACSPAPFSPNALPWDQAIVLLPNGVPANALPSILRHKVASWYAHGAIAAKVPEILTAATIGSDAFRLFISYRHEDSQVFAEQLFDALSRRQFDVFLDRFRTAPGSDFLERIRHELVDKACVLTLDSARVNRSAWVAGENAVALSYRLGRMAIDLPGGQQTFSGIRARLDLRGRASGPAFQANGLSTPDIDSAVHFVQQHYFAEIGRRPRHQRLLVRNAAARANVSVTARDDGLFEASDATGKKHYVLATSARPPATEQFRRTSDAAMPKERKVIIGPLETQLHTNRIDCEWLARASQCALVDERRIFQAMRHVHQGRL